MSVIHIVVANIPSYEGFDGHRNVKCFGENDLSAANELAEALTVLAFSGVWDQNLTSAENQKAQEAAAKMINALVPGEVQEGQFPDRRYDWDTDYAVESIPLG